MKGPLTATILFALSSAMTPLAFAGGQVGVNHQGDGSVQDAIRFEKAKDAADARQARSEAAHPTVAGAANPAAAAEQRAGTVRDQGVHAAIQFERNKDAADARQARTEAGRTTNSATSGNADRMAGHQQ